MTISNLATKEEAQAYRKQFGANLQAIRNEKGFTQQELAEKIGVAIPTLGCIETGKSHPQIRTLINLSKVLGVEIYRFFVFPYTKEIKIDEKLQQINKKIESIKDDERAVLSLSYFLETFK